MPINPRLKRIRMAAIILASLLAAYAIYWYWNMLGWLYKITDSATWIKFHIVENHAVISFGQKATYFTLLIPVLIIVTIAFYFAFKTAWAVYKGQIFVPQTAGYILYLGIWLAVSILYDWIISMALRPVLTWNNTGVDGMFEGEVSKAIGFLKPEIYFANGNITIFLCAVGFIMMGWVLYESALIEEENKRFV